MTSPKRGPIFGIPVFYFNLCGPKHDFQMKLKCLSLAAALLCISAAAQDNTPALPWSRIDHNPVTLGTATAGFADPGTAAWASFRNPAVLGIAPVTLDAAASWAGWMPSSDEGMLSHINAGAAWRFGKMGIAIGASYMPGKEYEIYSITGASEGSFTPKDLQLNLGFGYELISDLSLGVNVRYLKESLTAEDDLSAVAGDIAALYRIGPVTTALGLSNIGTAVKDAAGNSYSLPTSVTIGSTWDAALAEDHALKASVDADCYFSGDFTAALGAQYSFRNMIFARAGYHLATDGAVLPSFLTLGLGVSYAGFALDAAFLTANDVLANSFCLGLRYSF